MNILLFRHRLLALQEKGSGLAYGISTILGIGASLYAGVGAITGTASAVAVGASNAAGAGSSTGAATVLGVGSSSSSVNYSFTSGSLPSGTTFTRGSSGTYFNSGGTLSTASTNAARFDYNPTTYAALGLLYEAQSTNNVKTSNMSGWITTANASITLNSATSPDGTVDATLLTENTSSAAHGTSSQPSDYTYTSGTTYTASVYLLAGTATVAQMAFSGSAFPTSVYANFDLHNGVLGTVGGGATATITAVGNGWYRCTFTAAANASATTHTGDVYFTNNSTTASRLPSYTGTSKTLYAYGYQLEVGSVPTSFIATTGSAATRATDALAFTIPSGVSTLQYTFDDNSTQNVSVSAGAYTVPTNLSRARIKTIQNV